jgi:trans-2,3-dihydro-3-hydroxyanthranilate isomerase
VLLELAWWELGEGDPRVEELAANASIQSAQEEWRDVPNLCEKLWLISSATRRWGALMLWDGDKPALARLPRNVSAQVIGRPPDHRISFAVLEPTRDLG